MNKAFKVGIYKVFESATELSKAAGIGEAAISNLVRGHRLPTPSERERLAKVFSSYQLRKFFPRPKPQVEKVEGTKAVNE